MALKRWMDWKNLLPSALLLGLAVVMLRHVSAGPPMIYDVWTDGNSITVTVTVTDLSACQLQRSDSLIITNWSDIGPSVAPGPIFIPPEPGGSGAVFTG